MNKLAQDIRYALRTFRKSPVFTAVAILSLALGIGANTAIFTLLDQVMLRLLPVQNPEELVLLDAPGADVGAVRNSNAFSYPMYADLRDKNGVFTGMLARFPTNVSLAYKGNTERANAELVSGNYFDVLGVQSLMGRTITPDDDRTPGAHPVAVLTYSYWQRRFGGQSSILNQTINVNGYPMTVIGVTPPGFYGVEVGAPVDVMVPMMMKAEVTPTWNDLDVWRSKWLNIFARLKPGVSQEQATAAMNVLYSQLLQEDIKTVKGGSENFRKRFLAKKLTLLPGQTGRSSLRRQFSTPLIVLMSMVGLVLVIACANVANLLMARAAARQKEIAIRLSIGASRSQIVRQLMVESGLLALGGGLAGLLVAAWTGEMLLNFLPFEEAARSFSTEPNARILAFTLGVSILAALLFGLVPALQATRPGLASTLKNEAGSVPTGSGHVSLRKGLVVAQVALSLLLLIGAGLFARSLYNLRSLDPGFQIESLITFAIDPALSGFRQERVHQLLRELHGAITGLPGVRSASYAATGVMTNNRRQTTVRVEGYKSKEGEDMNPHINAVSPGYFATMGLPLVAGREFNELDRAGSTKVGLINETMARYFFGNKNPLGRRFGLGASEPDIEIAGVVKDGKSQNLRQEIPRLVYVPYLQDENPAQAVFYVRTAMPPEQTASALRSQVQRFDSNLPVFGMKTMETQIDESLFIERLIAMLSAFFGLLATVLAAIGLYGVMAYTVARRTREIGIRVALGAERGSVVWLVMKEVALMAMAGISIGLPAAYALSQLVKSQLYGLPPNDPLTLAAATAALALVSLLAGYVPAQRASRIDPLVALRYE